MNLHDLLNTLVQSRGKDWYTFSQGQGYPQTLPTLITPNHTPV